MVGEKSASGDLSFGNPVVDFLPERARALGEANGAPSRPDDAGPDETRIGALDAFVGALKGPVIEVLEHFGEMISAWGEHGQTFEEQRSAISAAQAEEGESARAVAVSLAGDVERSLSAIAQSTQEHIPLLDTRLERLTDASAALSIALEAGSGYGAETRARLVALRTGMEHSHLAATDALNAATALRQGLGQVTGITSELDKTIADTVHALDGAAFTLFALQAFALRPTPKTKPFRSLCTTHTTGGPRFRS